MDSLERVKRLTYWLENKFKIPGTNLTFGLDGIVGLIPGIGDVLGAACGAYIVVVAYQQRVSWGTLAHMILNILIDTLVGLVPLAGDLGDMVFKSNTRNMHLLEKELQKKRSLLNE